MGARLDAVGEAFTRTTGTLPGQTTFSWAGWRRIDVDRDTFTVLTDFDSTAGGIIRLRTDADGVSVLLVDSVSGLVATGPTLTVGTWVFFAIAKAGTGVGQTTLYWATESDPGLTSASGQSTAAGTVNTLRLGTGDNDPAQFLNGSLAADKVWTAALSEAELDAERGSLAAVRTADLNSEYHFASGALTTDSSGNGFTLSGGTGAIFTADPSFPGGGEAVRSLRTRRRGALIQTTARRRA